MTFQTIDSTWWHFLFILLAGWLMTDVWRWLGVWFAGRISTESSQLVLVRIVATALIGAVVGNLLVYPSGQLAATPLLLRLGAMAAGFVAYLCAGRRMIVGIIVAEAIMAAWFVAA